MPHGAGHHGGGHHGGGGHHHHHHGGHHHHHHVQGANVGYFGSGYGRPYGYYYRRRPLSWVIFSILVTVAIILSATISVRYTTYTDDDGLQYSPTDTRILSVTNLMCQGLEMTVNIDSDYGYTASLYMLKLPPVLTGVEEFSIQDTPDISSSDLHYYYYYMHPGSNFTVSVCENSSPSSTVFTLIQGNKNFEKWKRGSYFVPVEQVLTVSSICGTSNDTLTYYVRDEGYYYFILEDPFYYVQPTINIAFRRTYYEIKHVSNNTVVDSCWETTNGGTVSCSVRVPLSGQTAYLTVAPQDSSSVNWLEDRISVETSCQPRIWVYVVISISALIGALAVLVPVVICACICVNKKKKRAQTSAAAANAPLLNDPVINPQAPQQNPPGYGSNFGAPPVYKP